MKNQFLLWGVVFMLLQPSQLLSQFPDNQLTFGAGKFALDESEWLHFNLSIERRVKYRSPLCYRAGVFINPGYEIGNGSNTSFGGLGGLTYLPGNGRHHFVFSAAAAIQFGSMDFSDQQALKTGKSAEFYPFVEIGYRFQPPDNSWIFQISSNTMALIHISIGHTLYKLPLLDRHHHSDKHLIPVPPEILKQ